MNRYAAVVLVAVYSLTVNLATRYVSPCGFSVHSVKTFQRQIPPDAQKQRLAADAANWMPPAFLVVLRAPSLCPRLASSVLVPSLLLEENFYTRPPPIG
jgi:hypothetical protein